MKIQYVSDLHLELSDIDIVNAEGADVLVLAGDITAAADLDRHPDTEDKMRHLPKLGPRQKAALRYRDFLRRCSERFAHVVYVAGNHEFYHGSWTHTLTVLRAECKLLPNVHFLEREQVVIDGVTFIGSTLWTSVKNGDPLITLIVKEGMNDYKVIRDENYSKINPHHTVKRHLESLRFISNAVEDAVGDVVVVSHHLPSFRSINERYMNSPNNHAYATDLDGFIDRRPKIKLWIHGHSHNVADYEIGTTRVVCNPRGYHSAGMIEQTGWNPNATATV